MNQDNQQVGTQMGDNPVAEGTQTGDNPVAEGTLVEEGMPHVVVGKTHVQH